MVQEFKGSVSIRKPQRHAISVPIVSMEWTGLRNYNPIMDTGCINPIIMCSSILKSVEFPTLFITQDYK